MSPKRNPGLRATEVGRVIVGRAFAQAIPTARFDELLTETGHSPQLETPAQVLEALNGKARHPRR